MIDQLTFPDELSLFFAEQVSISNFTLEYGSGASTLFLANSNKRCMSVESDYSFLLNLLQKISLRNITHSIIPVFINIGPTKEWGHPIDNSSEINWHEYSIQPWQILSSVNISPDLVLIDGRFRVACMLATMASISKPTKVIFDDYVGRPYKEIIEQFILPIKFVDRAAYFEVSPREISTLDILRCIDSFFDPR